MFGFKVRLTFLYTKADRMLLLVHGATFQWYFTGAQTFSGILRRSRSFDATQPIFPWNYSLIVI
jgi:hypothetical protein